MGRYGAFVAKGYFDELFMGIRFGKLPVIYQLESKEKKRKSAKKGRKSGI
jgi:hypothetical protein